jgi:hypothetical protein
MASTSSNDQRAWNAKASLDDKPALVALTDSSDRASDHGSQEGKLEEGAFYNSTATNLSSSFTGAEEKKLLRRIDWHLLPLLAAMYVVKTIDAQNVSYLSYGFLTRLIEAIPGFKCPCHG